MKIKFNWGTAIVIAILLFMTFILSFVYKVTFVDKYDHHLVSEDYYKDELLYQKEINQLENANSLATNVSLLKTSEGLLITFPEEFKNDSITGTLQLMRLSDKRLDLNEELQLSNNQYLIPADKLTNGKYDVRIAWRCYGKEYLLKEDYTY